MFGFNGGSISPKQFNIVNIVNISLVLITFKFYLADFQEK